METNQYNAMPQKKCVLNIRECWSLPDNRKGLEYTGNTPQREKVISTGLKWCHDLRVMAIQVQTALEIDMGGRQWSLLVGEKVCFGVFHVMLMHLDFFL